MLSKIKELLINNPDKIIELLEHYNFYNMVNHGKYISFGRAENSSKKSIVIRLENNDWLYVKDYAKNINQDIFSYIINQRGVEFKDVLRTAKSILGIEDYYTYFQSKKGIFGGIYDRIKKKNSNKIITYSEEILDSYPRKGNLRFLKDNISLLSQKFFNLRFDEESQGILIPIYTQTGDLMGIKVRTNYDSDEDDFLKYWYLKACQMSQTLYGYSFNYEYLVNNVVYVFESEKSVMQCHSYGIRNCVALGSGSISKKQCEMLLELNPTKIIFMHDFGYKYKYIERNITMLKSYSRFSEIEIGYWDWTIREEKESKKVSPSDLGKEELLYIIENEIRMVVEDGEEKDDSLE